MVIKKGTLSDIPEIATVDRLSFSSDPYPSFVLRQLYDLFSDLIFVAKEESRIVGYILGGVSAGNRGWVLSLAVVPDKRSRGVGGALLERLLNEFQSKNISNVFLTVSESNAQAIGLYHSKGFEDIRVEDNYFFDGEARMLMMWEA